MLGRQLHRTEAPEDVYKIWFIHINSIHFYIAKMSAEKTAFKKTKDIER